VDRSSSFAILCIYFFIQQLKCEVLSELKINTKTKPSQYPVSDSFMITQNNAQKMERQRNNKTTKDAVGLTLTLMIMS